MAARAAIKDNLQATEWQVDVVVDYYQLLGFFNRSDKWFQTLAGVVHHSLRHHQEHFGFANLGARDQSVRLLIQLPLTALKLLPADFQNNPPGIMPRTLVFLPRIS